MLGRAFSAQALLMPEESSKSYGQSMAMEGGLLPCKGKWEAVCCSLIAGAEEDFMPEVRVLVAAGPHGQSRHRSVKEILLVVSTVSPS